MNNLEIATQNLNTNSYGRTLCTDGNNIGKALPGDSYYLVAASNGKLKLGYQKNNQTDVIWYSDFATKDDLDKKVYNGNSKSIGLFYNESNKVVHFKFDGVTVGYIDLRSV